MSTTITRTADFPKHRFYILANDSFMSGWGGAKGKTNTVVLGCDSTLEASTVEQNALNRSDMRHVRCVGNPPRMRSHVVFSYMDKDDAARWYEPGGFSK